MIWIIFGGKKIGTGSIFEMGKSNDRDRIWLIILTKDRDRIWLLEKRIVQYSEEDRAPSDQRSADFKSLI